MSNLSPCAAISGEELVVQASILALAVSKSMDNDELTAFCELLGLLKHDLDIIRFRRFLKKVEKKIEEKKPDKKD